MWKKEGETMRGGGREGEGKMKDGMEKSRNAKKNRKMKMREKIKIGMKRRNEMKNRKTEKGVKMKNGMNWGCLAPAMVAVREW